MYHPITLRHVRNYLTVLVRYTFHSKEKTYMDARADCQQRGGDMISRAIDKLTYADYFKGDEGEEYEIWIGIKSNTNNWSWPNGTIEKNWISENGQITPVIPVKEDYCGVYMKTGYGDTINTLSWASKSCSYGRYSYLCEYAGKLSIFIIY